jgi:hypothetical protein
VREEEGTYYDEWSPDGVTSEAHTEEICSECGQAVCATVMHETPDSVGADSMDIRFRLVCPYCWMRAEVTRLQAEKAATESTGWRREDELLGRVQAVEAANYQLQAQNARLREALSAINAVPRRTATPLKKMRIMWDMATAALDKEGT